MKTDKNLVPGMPIGAQADTDDSLNRVLDDDNNIDDDNNGLQDGIDLNKDPFEDDDNGDEIDWNDSTIDGQPSLQNNGMSSENTDANVNDDNNGENNDDQDDSLNFDENNNDNNDDFDLEKFNKKLNKNFQTQQELMDYLQGNDQKQEDQEDDKTLEQHNEAITAWEQFIGLDDTSLIRANLEQIQIQKGKDVNDSEIAFEIESQLNEMADKGTLPLRAEILRNKLQAKVSESKTIVKGITDKREAAELETKKAITKKTQDALAKFYTGDKNFYGVTLSKQDVLDTYKDINSGDFIQRLQSNPELTAELALLFKHKNIVRSKAEGKTYSDGVNDLLNELGTSKKRDIHRGNAGLTSSSRNTATPQDDDDSEFIAGFVK